VNERTQDI